MRLCLPDRILDLMDELAPRDAIYVIHGHSQLSVVLLVASDGSRIVNGSEQFVDGGSAQI